MCRGISGTSGYPGSPSTQTPGEEDAPKRGFSIDTDLLTSILTLLVVAGDSLDLQQLIDVGTVTTVNGETLTIEASGDLATVNGANVICGNVAVANGTVHIIDTVLAPQG